VWTARRRVQARERREGFRRRGGGTDAGGDAPARAGGGARRRAAVRDRPLLDLARRGAAVAGGTAARRSRGHRGPHPRWGAAAYDRRGIAGCQPARVGALRAGPARRTHSGGALAGDGRADADPEDGALGVHRAASGPDRRDERGPAAPASPRDIAARRPVRSRLMGALINFLVLMVLLFAGLHRRGRCLRAPATASPSSSPSSPSRSPSSATVAAND